MAAFTELESSVLRDSESQAEVPAPAHGRALRIALTVGLCLTAALVGAAVIKPGLTGSVRHTTDPVGRWGIMRLDSESEHVFQHMTPACVDAMNALEDEYEEADKQHEGFGETIDCDSDVMTCVATVTWQDQTFNMSKCFPTVCKPANIELELNNDPDKPDGMNATVECSD